MIISREALTTAMVATTTDRTRYALDAVNVRAADGKTIAEATNGHLAVRVAEPVTPDADWPVNVLGGTALVGPVLVSSATIKSAAAATRGKHTLPICGMVRLADNGAGRRMAQTCAKMVGEARQIGTADDATFPELDRQMAQVEPADGDIMLGLSGEMLEDLAALVKAAGGGGVHIRIPKRSVNAEKGEIDGALGFEVFGLPRYEGRTVTGVFMGTRVVGVTR